MTCPDCLQEGVNETHIMTRECLQPTAADAAPKPDPNCTTCHGTGWVDDPVSGLSVHCSCISSNQ